MRFISGLFLVLIFFSVRATLAQDGSALNFGSSVTIHSDVLNEDRTCFISLPDSYVDDDDDGHTYPIIILLDGYTFFKTTVGIVHFMSSSRNRNYLMPATIVVAIENVDRERDLTVTKIKTKRVNTMGGGRNFLDFIEKELIPYVDKNSLSTEIFPKYTDLSSD